MGEVEEALLAHSRPQHDWTSVASSEEWSTMKVREVIDMIEEDGWYIVATKGDHRQYKHPTKPGRVTIAGHPGDDLVLAP